MSPIWSRRLSGDHPDRQHGRTRGNRLGTWIDISERDLHVIEIGTTVLVLLILLMVYRNLITMLVPLVTIGISLATAQGVLAGAGRAGPGYLQSDHCFHERDNIRRRNGLRRLPHQPLPRLRPACV